MTGWRRPFATTVGAATVWLAWAAPPASAFGPAPADPPTPAALAPPPLRADAEAAERAGDWELALDLRLQQFFAGGAAPDVRDRVRECLRNAARVRRHRDPAFQQYVLSLKPAQALDLYAEAVEKLSHLSADRTRATVDRLYAAGLDELDRALSSPGFRQKALDGPADAKIQAFQQTLRGGRRTRLPATPRDARAAAFELVRDAREQLGARAGTAVVFELLCGACSGLDEFTTYLAPGADGADVPPVVELAGYGLLVRPIADELIVDGVVPGSWAAHHTGVRKGDRVVRVNGRPLDAATPAALAQAVRAAGMYGHELDVTAADGTPVSVPVRLPVPLPTVYAVDMVRPMDGVGALRLAAIADTTPQELDAAVLSLKARGARALVIDARGNPGGSFPAALQVAQRFLPGGIIVTTQGQAPEFAGHVFSSDAGMTAFDLPVVLLVDARTMSAAEAVAVAWKDNDRAVLVGLPTFGKGAIQGHVRLTAVAGPDGGRSGELVLTVATMTGPRGGAISGVGVTPHVLEADPDRQLAAAIAKAIERANGMR